MTDGMSNAGKKGRLGVGRVQDPVVPLELVNADLSIEARFVYIFLLSKCDRNSRQLRGTQAAMAEALRIDRTTFRKCVTALEQAGWLRLERAGRRETIFTVRNPVLEERQAEVRRVQARLGPASFKGEALMCEWLDLIVASTEYDNNARLGYIRNPMTDACLEFDRYYFKHKVAFEFNGPQHYGPTEAYPDPDRARETMTRDYIKKALCHEHGIHLIILTAKDLSFKTITEKARGLLPLREVRPDDPVLQYLTQVSRQYMRAVRRGQAGQRGQAPPPKQEASGWQAPPPRHEAPQGQAPPTGQEALRGQAPPHRQERAT